MCLQNTEFCKCGTITHNKKCLTKPYFTHGQTMDELVGGDYQNRKINILVGLKIH
jgi:hypothetical protein